MKIELNGIVDDRLQELKSTWNKCYRETGNWNDMRFAIEQLFLSVYGNIDGVAKEGSGDVSENETVAEICSELKEVANGQNVGNDGLVIEISQEEIWDALDRIETTHEREVEELSECLKEAVGCADEFQKFFETHPYLCKYTRDVVKKSSKILRDRTND